MEHHLIVAIPDKEPINFSVSGDEMTLGRAPDNDIQVLVREVSTTHCKFVLSEGEYHLEDLGSTNGTKVNDQSIKNGRTHLNSHDIIILGETTPCYFVEI
ncbi:MAG: FHA domain-containing protein, partial [Verrucomicrobiota bacterium]